MSHRSFILAVVRQQIDSRDLTMDPFRTVSQWCQEEGGWELEIVGRDREASGFKVIPKRCILERIISWIDRNRRMSKDYERRVQTSECLVKAAKIRLILRRLARAA